MNKRKAKKLTLAQLKEQNKYVHARARAAEFARDQAASALTEVMATTDAILCCVAELNGSGELSIPMCDIRRAMKEKKVVVEVVNDTYKVKAVRMCEASTEV
jgi:hypothetical protein